MGYCVESLMSKLDDLKFILQTMEKLIVDPDIEFGPAYSIAKSDHELSMTKLRRLIKQEKLNNP